MDGDPRLSILPADWPVRETGPHNDDSGRKKHALNDHVLAQGGGLFMLVDADDWVDRETVAAARACIGPEEVGGLIEAGMILDLRTRRIAALPHPDIFPGEFHRLCGTSTVACLRPGTADPVRRDPFSTLRSHHQWLEMARERGVRLAPAEAQPVRLSRRGVAGGAVAGREDEPRPRSGSPPSRRAA